MLRSRILCCATAGLLAFAAGCQSSTETKPPSSSTEKEGVTNHKARVAAHRARLGELEKKLDDQKAMVEKATGEEKSKLEAKWKESVAKRDAAKKKIDELETAGADGNLSSDAVAANKAAGDALDEFKKSVE
jgi:hypothetical protein